MILMFFVLVVLSRLVYEALSTYGCRGENKVSCFGDWLFSLPLIPLSIGSELTPDIDRDYESYKSRVLSGEVLCCSIFLCFINRWLSWHRMKVSAS